MLLLVRLSNNDIMLFGDYSKNHSIDDNVLESIRNIYGIYKEGIWNLLENL